MSELKALMDDDEMSSWLAYARVEGLPHSWLQTGAICSCIGKVGLRTWESKPQDWVPTVPRPQTVDEMKAALRTYRFKPRKPPTK